MKTKVVITIEDYMDGIQMGVHPKFLELLKKIRKDRYEKHSEKLSFKRLSLLIYKLIKKNPELYKMIVNANINLKEI